MRFKGRIKEIRGSEMIIELGEIRQVEKVNKKGQSMGFFPEFVKKALGLEIGQTLKGKTARIFVRVKR